MAGPNLFLGSWKGLDDETVGGLARMPANHLVTHAVIVGMTGSGKTGLIVVQAEEALRSGIPTLMIDVKGDLPNLLLAFPRFDPADLVPWVEPVATSEDKPLDQAAADVNALRRDSLKAWSIAEAELRAFVEHREIRVITPGSTAGELMHVLSSLERRSSRWDSDPEAAADALSAAVSLVLRLLGRDPDPAKSREHVLLSVLAERRLRSGIPADLESLLEDLREPPIDKIGALSLDAFLSKTDRKSLAAALNTLLASPTFAMWREGVSLDVGEWLKPRNGKTPGVIVSVAHLDDQERSLVLGVLLEELLAWVRSLPGSSRLKALVMFDEVYGFLPPHPANPPTKRPLVALMKQARAFGVGVVIATQNPMDLDYRALGNAGVWCIGRLQTDADCARVLDGLASAGDDGYSTAELGQVVKHLAPRWFLMRDVHAPKGTFLLQPRWAMSFLRGPMTRSEIRGALEMQESAAGTPSEPGTAGSNGKTGAMGMLGTAPALVGAKSVQRR